MIRPQVYHGKIQYAIYTNATAEKWYSRYLRFAFEVAKESEDEKTQVGAQIFTPDFRPVSFGWNGLPRKVKLTPERQERPEKYFYFEHAERNAIYNAAAEGHATRDALIAITHFPCMDCARGIVQCSIKTVITPVPDFLHPRWGAQWKKALEMFSEAHVSVVFMETMHAPSKEGRQESQSEEGSRSLVPGGCV
jgi:dCMP deaminase